MCKITKYDVIAQLEWFLENNDWVESLDCDNVDNHTKESLRWVIDYLNKDNERKQGAVEELELDISWLKDLEDYAYLFGHKGEMLNRITMRKEYQNKRLKKLKESVKK
jgi:hypothetical protein